MAESILVASAARGDASFAPLSNRRADLASARPSWSWKIGDLFGIGVYVHATFGLLLAWVSLSYYRLGGNLRATLSGVVLMLSVFAIIVMHELGHALMARHFGIRTRSILLLPIGGVASLERMPEKPSQELLVALAGPAVNVALAIALAVVAIVIGETPLLANLELVGGPLLQKLIFVNLSLAIFNLLPAFPMDGGRALRALLAFKMGRIRATELAARLGQAFALFFGFVGLTMNPMLVLVALFVWTGAHQEAAMVRVQSVLSGIPVWRATISQFQSVSSTEPLSVAVERIVTGTQHEFPVVDSGRLVGVLTRADIVRGLSAGGPTLTAGDAMHREFETADPDESLEQVLPRLPSGEPVPLMVVRRGELVGMLTNENLAELLMLRGATS